MRVTQITTCKDKVTNAFKGFAFKLSDPKQENESYFDIPFMGKAGPAEKVECTTVSISNGITSIESLTNDDGIVVGL